jgi:spore germination protein GerM
MRFAAPLALLTCLVAGCTIGSTDTVEEIEPGELAALDRTSTSTTTLPQETPPVGSLSTIDTDPPDSGPVESVPATTVAEPTELVELYFVNGSEIVPIDTPVAAPVAERRILDALGLGPPPAEFEAGVRTAVPTNLVVRFRKGAVATVDLDAELFRGIDPGNQRHAVAQIVLTLTRLPGIDSVLFTVGGDPLSVYQRNDELTEPGEPVTREDYEELLADNADSV